MSHLTKHWIVAARPTAEQERLLLNYPSILRQILINRGYTTPQSASQYLEARPPAGTLSSILGGMSKAVERIRKAIKDQEVITIYGDYDVDGVTATALLCQALNELNARVRWRIPRRLDEGYGLNNEALDAIYQEGSSLVITVDCGIRSPKEVSHARQIGLDMIITDHHAPDNDLPEALAIINPKQIGDPYGEKELAGVGLAYKLACALLDEEDAGRMTAYLDLVALGTVADMVPLTGENRSLVRAGMEYLRKPQRQGIKSLIGACGLTPDKINASSIGFTLGPRLNAAGRLETAEKALRLLLSNNPAETGLIAQELEATNHQRQVITEQTQKQAEEIALAKDPDALLLFAAHSDFNPGVVGLAASRLTELYHRPAIVASQGDEYTRASCRSIPELHITAVLDECKDLLEHHGGHASAAGFTVANRNLPELVDRLHKIVLERLDGQDIRPKLAADVEIPLVDLKPGILDELKQLEPTGQGNPRAVFVSRNLRITRYRTVGREDAHLKLTVTDGKITYDAIAFRQGQRIIDLPDRIDVMYIFEANEFNGQTTMQLNVRDLKPAGLPD